MSLFILFGVIASTILGILSFVVSAYSETNNGVDSYNIGAEMSTMCKIDDTHALEIYWYTNGDSLKRFRFWARIHTLNANGTITVSGDTPFDQLTSSTGDAISPNEVIKTSSDTYVFTYVFNGIMKVQGITVNPSTYAITYGSIMSVFSNVVYNQVRTIKLTDTTYLAICYYTDGGGTYSIRAIQLSRSGLTFSTVGTRADYYMVDPDGYNVAQMRFVGISATKIAVFYVIQSNGTNPGRYAVYITINGSTTTIGTPTKMNTDAVYTIYFAVLIPNTNKVVLELATDYAIIDCGGATPTVSATIPIGSEVARSFTFIDNKTALAIVGVSTEAYVRAYDFDDIANTIVAQGNPKVFVTNPTSFKIPVIMSTNSALYVYKPYSGSAEGTSPHDTHFHGKIITW